MRETSRVIANYGLFLVTAAIFTGLQVSLWLQIFDLFPPPHMWVPCLVYWTLYRSPKEGLTMAYLLSLVMASFTSMPYGMILICVLALFVTFYVVKLRIYSAGVTYYMIVCGGAAALFPIYYTAVSWMNDANPITHPEFFSWIMQPLLTCLACLPFYQLFAWFDQLTKKEMLPEMEVIPNE